MPLSLRDVVATLGEVYGSPPKLPATGAYELVLWENVAYLVDDDRRLAVWERLERDVGLQPNEILEAPEELLVETLEGSGMHVGKRAVRLREIATRVVEHHDGDLDSVLELPIANARKALKAFPAIGDPGADKILLFTGTAPVLALDSNGLRVLLRLGYGAEASSYSTTYKSVQRSLADQVGADCEFLARAHGLLRRHGQTTCRNTRPACAACLLAARCPSA